MDTQLAVMPPEKTLTEEAAGLDPAASLPAPGGLGPLGRWEGLWLMVKAQLLALVIMLLVFGVREMLGLPRVKGPTILMASAIGSAWVIWRRCQQCRVTWRELTGTFVPGWALAFSLAGALVGFLLVEVPLLTWLTVRYPWLNIDADLGIAQSPWTAFCGMVILVPLCEELLFRAICTRGFVARYGVRRGLLTGAVWFALLHLAPVKLPGMLIAGLVLGWLYWRTKSVWPGVLLHAANNGLAFWLAMRTSPEDLSGFLIDWTWVLTPLGALLWGGFGFQVWRQLENLGAIRSSTVGACSDGITR